MAFVRYKGKTKTMWFNKDTTCELRAGSLVMMSDSAEVMRARNDSTNDKILGVAVRNDTTTDSGPVPIEVPVELAVEWTINTDSDGGAVDSDIGRIVGVDTEGGTTAGDSSSQNLDISDSSSATRAASVFITGVISATKVIGVITHTAWAHSFDTAA